MTWFCDTDWICSQPFREQAGPKSQRGCMEHIVTLRLLRETARRKKVNLFVTLFDFSKAYNLVCWNKLCSISERLGSGTVMLAALVAMYSITVSVMATLWVGQGSPTSCLLYIYFFVNEFIRLVNQRCLPVGFLD